MGWTELENIATLELVVQVVKETIFSSKALVASFNVPMKPLLSMEKTMKKVKLMNREGKMTDGTAEFSVEVDVKNVEAFEEYRLKKHQRMGSMDGGNLLTSSLRQSINSNRKSVLSFNSKKSGSSNRNLERKINEIEETESVGESVSIRSPNSSILDLIPGEMKLLSELSKDASTKKKKCLVVNKRRSVIDIYDQLEELQNPENNSEQLKNAEPAALATAPNRKLVFSLLVSFKECRVYLPV